MGSRTSSASASSAIRTSVRPTTGPSAATTGTRGTEQGAAESAAPIVTASEVDPRSQAPDARTLQLLNPIPGTGVRIAIQEQQRLALQHRALVRHVEQIGRERDADAVHDAEILRRAEVELEDIRETNAADLVQHHVVHSVVDAHFIPPDLRIALPAAEACPKAEIPRQLIEAGDVGVPFRV